MEVLGLIPARFGSSEIKKKNIRHLEGKPLIYYSIIEALKARGIKRVVLSTDSKIFQKIGTKYGAEAPFLRPNELATNEAGLFPVIMHCLNFLKENDNYYPDAVFLLRPTSPFRKAMQIDEAINLLKCKNADSVISMAPVKQHPHFMFRHNDNEKLEEYIKIEHKPEINNHWTLGFNTRRQNLPKVWAYNCHTMISTTSYLCKAYKKGNFQLNFKKFAPYFIDEISALDIDTELDFKFAEFIMKNTKK